MTRSGYERPAAQEQKGVVASDHLPIVAEFEITTEIQRILIDHVEETFRANFLSMGSYLRFGSMILTSTVVMYFLMYVNTYEADHIFFSQTRLFMTIIMGASMGIIMLVFMLGMYKNKKLNVGIFVLCGLLFFLALWLVRSQETVQDVSYMKAMIPHHSIAILTSERAEISDPRVRKLADEIIEAQRREINEMKSLIEDIEAAR